MEKILLFQISEEKAAQIQRLASPLRVRVQRVPEDAYGEPLGKLADSLAPAKKNGTEKAAFPQSLMLFCGVTEKHLDKILAGLKRERITVDYKAVLTPTNRNWTVQTLFLELIRERAALNRS